MRLISFGEWAQQSRIFLLFLGITMTYRQILLYLGLLKHLWNSLLFIYILKMYKVLIPSTLLTYTIIIFIINYLHFFILPFFTGKKDYTTLLAICCCVYILAVYSCNWLALLYHVAGNLRSWEKSPLSANEKGSSSILLLAAFGPL